MSTAIRTAQTTNDSASSSASPYAFHKTSAASKFDQFPKMSTHTSLLDVIRSQGHVMLDANDRVSMRSSTMPIPMMSDSSQLHQPKSKPIPIVSPSHHHLHTSHYHDLQAAEDEDPMSTSAELERFYDQATWRMYVLIQSARQSSHYTASHHTHYSTPGTTSTALDKNNEWTTSCPLPMVEKDDGEDIFDLEL